MTNIQSNEAYEPSHEPEQAGAAAHLHLLGSEPGAGTEALMTTGSPMSGKIFVNYPGHSEGWAIAVDQALNTAFGAGNVFLAGRSIAAGLDFERELEHAARSCAVLVALIGPHWSSTIFGARGKNQSGFWVRREIKLALAEGRPVIPTMIDDTPELRPQDLPADIANLARRQAIRIRHQTYQQDLNNLVGAIRPYTRSLGAGTTGS